MFHFDHSFFYLFYPLCVIFKHSARRVLSLSLCFLLLAFTLIYIVYSLFCPIHYLPIHVTANAWGVRLGRRFGEKLMHGQLIHANDRVKAHHVFQCTHACWRSLGGDVILTLLFPFIQCEED